MKQVLIFIFLFLLYRLITVQKPDLKLDVITGIHKSTGSLNFKNKYGWRIVGGIRYSFKDKFLFNILQVNYDRFFNPMVTIL